MAKRDSGAKHSVVAKDEKIEVAATVQPAYNYSVQSVQSRVAARVIYIGAVTGNRYEWPVAGAVVSVDTRDVPELLSKRLGNSLCCGNDNGIFEII